mmetsp:Transcript_64505/g.154045  ORF Transcript_64505/g.154045 Transcript_64505/m.154045 type:complete len:294 (-) Transcript_64505:143-1024(-)
MGNKNSAYQAKFKAKEWQWQLKTEAKHLEKEIQKIQKGEQKLRKEIEMQAEKGNVDSVQMLAKQIVRSQKAVKRLEKTKASMHAVDLQLATSIATMTTTSSLKVSADVMANMNKICGVSEVGATMEQMRTEMARVAEAEDSVEQALQNEDEDYDAAMEVQKVLEGMALAKMGPLSVSTAPEKVPAQKTAAEEAPPVAQPSPPQKQLVAVGETESAPSSGPSRQQPQQPAAQQPQPPAPQQALQPQQPSSLGQPPAENLQPAADPPAAAPASGASAPPGGEEDELWARLNALKK